MIDVIDVIGVLAIYTAIIWAIVKILALCSRGDKE